MIMDWVRKAPTAIVVTMILTCGVLALGVLGAYVYLTATGADTTEFRQWVTTIGQLALYPLIGTTAVASVSAAKSASRADENTNGNLHARDEEIGRLRARLNAAGIREGD